MNKKVAQNELNPKVDTFWAQFKKVLFFYLKRDIYFNTKNMVK